MTYLDIQVGDIVRLRKQHPCGSWEWEIVRTGADIGIVCTTCRRRLLMPRHKFRKAVKTIERRGSPPVITAEPPSSDSEPTTTDL